MKPLPPPERIKLDVRRAKTYSLGSRESKVEATEVGRPLEAGLSFAQWFDRIPDILAGADLRFTVDAITKARRRGRGAGQVYRGARDARDPQRQDHAPPAARDA